VIHSYEDYQRGFETIAGLSRDATWLPGHDPAMLDELQQVADGVYRVL
jgi:hypothetical protein